MLRTRITILQLKNVMLLFTRIPWNCALLKKVAMDFLFEIALQSLIIFHFDDVFPPSLNRDVFAAFRGKEKGWRFNSIYVLVNCVRKLTRRDSLWMDKGRCLLLFCFGLC